MTPQRLFASLALGCLLVACEGAYSPGAASDASSLDALAPTDVRSSSEVTDAPPPDIVLDGGCPAPARIAPAQVPRGYLTPMVLRLTRTVDGDTAHFTYPVRGDITVRFLYVNTEESRGAEATAFGMRTADTVAGYLQSARELSVAIREEPRMPGTPDLDPFNRWLGLVFLDGDLFETRLVREGLSAYYTEFGCAPEPLHTVLIHAEAEARANLRGIWAPGHPTSYAMVFARWFGSNRCRPNPFRDQPYCR